jgi:hypothetical protein
VVRRQPYPSNSDDGKTGVRSRETTGGVVLVEGESDRIAVERLAARLGRRLRGEGVSVLSMGGAHAIHEHLRRLALAAIPAAGLCDVAEEAIFRHALETAGLGEGLDRETMAEIGFHVCVEDLEDELIRAVGEEAVEGVLERQGDLPAFRTLQNQPDWRGAAFTPQMRRWIGAGARRKTRYARLLVDAVDLDRAPPPLLGVLDAF